MVCFGQTRNTIDGVNRRIRKDLYEASSSTSSSSTGDTNERHFYHSQQWQVIEEKLAGAGEPNRQYVWGLRFVDDQDLCRRCRAHGPPIRHFRTRRRSRETPAPIRQHLQGKE